MMRRCAISSLAILVLFVALPHLASASETAAEILLESEATLAVAGQIYTNRLRVELPEGGILGALSIGGTGWSAINLQQPPSGAQLPGTVLFLDFDVLPTDTNQALSFSIVVNNETIALSYSLSLKDWKRANLDLNVAMVDSSSTPAPGAPIYPASGLSPLPLEGASAQDFDDRDRRAKARSITVRGRLAYLRNPAFPVSGVPATRVGAYGCTVEVYDDDAIGRTLLGSTTTDGGGYFNTIVSWTGGLFDTNPDIYVIFRTRNADITTKPHGLLTKAYHFKTSTYTDFTESDLNVGTLVPDDMDDHPALNIHANMCRTYTWLSARGYATSRHLTVRFPSGGFPHYNSFSRSIHIPRTADDALASEDWQWHESTHAHEFGHHWMHEYSVDHPGWGGYCNPGGYYDSSGDCGHGLWCDENGDVAWDEGVPDWIANAVTLSYPEDWGLEVIHGLSKETVSPCPALSTGSTWVYGDPLLTEGSVLAFLSDVMDDDPDSLPSNPGGYTDALNTPSIDAQQILAILVGTTPHSPLEFIEAFKNAHNWDQDFWETARYAGYIGIDTVAPNVVPSINSTSHTVGVSAPDATIDLNWIRPGDDFSGTLGYSVRVAATPGLPDNTSEVVSLGTVIEHSTGVLAPGSYYVSVRTRDRAGNWGTTYQSNGPYIINASEPSDITYGRNLGAAQQGPLVLRSDTTATTSVIQWATGLLGDTGPVYFNVITTNLGTVDVSKAFLNPIYVDGELTGLAMPTVSSLPGLSNHITLNWGPYINIPAGRHVVSVHYDGIGTGFEKIAELDETNNTYATQRVFFPTPMAPMVLGTRPAPPDPKGGEEDYDSPFLLQAENQDGLRFDTGSTFDAVVTWAQDNADNYDCTLTHRATSTTNGFSATVSPSLPALSERGPGLIDAVITNGQSSLAKLTWDVGVVGKTRVSKSDYNYIQIKDQPLALGPGGTVSMDATERLILRRVTITPVTLGAKTVSLSSDPILGPLHLALYSAAFDYGSLNDYMGHAVTDESGSALLGFLADTTGQYLVAVWRDPADDPMDTLATVTFELSVHTAEPDLVLLDPPASWYSPLVPRADTAGLPSTVFAPTSLTGDAAATYFNINAYNQGVIVAAGVDAALQIDGVPLVVVPLGNCPGESNVTLNMTTPLTIPGGRHMASIDLDTSNAIVEASEINNRFAEQYVWQPAALPPDGLTTRTAPRGPVAGWNSVTALRGPLTFNCDGLYFDPPAGEWVGVAALPDPGVDVDLRLHEVNSTAKNGFAAPLVFSGWGAGELDFLLVNTIATIHRPFHVGVIGSSGSGSYALDSVGSNPLGTDPAGSFGPFTMQPDELMNLYGVTLSAGVYQISLASDSGVNLGFSVHSGATLYASRSRALDDGVSYIELDPTRQFVTIKIETTGSYCLAVWRRGHASAPKLAKAALAYDLAFNAVTSTGDDIPNATVTRIRSVYPTPFNPRLFVDLDVVRDGIVVLEVLDLRGKRIRTLTNTRLSAGRHQIVWNGDDARGQSVAAGVYLIRLGGVDGTDVRKVALVK